MRFFLTFLVLAACIGLSACESEKVSIPYLGVNHTDDGIISVIVNGEGGILDIPAQGGAGTKMCCINMPKKWQPGLTAEIKWQVAGTYQRDARGEIVTNDGVPVVISAPYKTMTVEVPKYSERDLQHFDIHIMPGDKVMVKASFLYPTHRDYIPAYPEATVKTEQ